MNKYKDSKRFLIVVAVILAIGFIAAIIFFAATPLGHSAWNNWFYGIQKVDDATSYETRKKVEDTCRSMLASYEADKATYLQYVNSDSEERQSWAEQAKMRANRTASTYNKYILSNSFVWESNIPEDIKSELELLE